MISRVFYLARGPSSPQLPSFHRVITTKRRFQWRMAYASNRRWGIKYKCSSQAKTNIVHRTILLQPESSKSIVQSSTTIHHNISNPQTPNPSPNLQIQSTFISVYHPTRHISSSKTPTTLSAALATASTSLPSISVNTYLATSSFSLPTGLPIPTPTLKTSNPASFPRAGNNPFPLKLSKTLINPRCPRKLALSGPPRFTRTFPSGASSSSCRMTSVAGSVAGRLFREESHFCSVLTSFGPEMFIRLGLWKVV